MTKQKQIRIAFWAAATVLLLGLAVYFVAPSFICTSNEARARLAQVMAADIIERLKLYELDKGGFPSQKAGLVALVEEGHTRADLLVDPWGQPFVYACGSPNCASITVYSIGENGKDEGGKGDDIGKIAEMRK
jgi:type II secretion system protein G